MADDELEGRVAIVTGGSRGIGFAVAEELGNRGASTMICARSEHQVDEAVEALAQAGQGGGYACDLSADGQAEELVKRTVAKFGHLDTLICCHGIYDQQLAPFSEFAAETFAETMRINVSSVFRICQSASRAMARAGVTDGRIVLVSSVDALAAEPNCVGYNTSKAALIGLAKSMSLDLAPDICTNIVAPGWVSTPMTANSLPQDVLDGDAHFALNPLGRIGQPEDIAYVIAGICDPRNRYMTGSVIVVDGGQTSALSTPDHPDSTV